ncbi:hypothetical protein ACN38_g9433, partial [Penicillium nordicum]
SIQIHFRFTSDSLQIHFRFTSDSLQIHFRFNSDSIQIHFRHTPPHWSRCGPARPRQPGWRRGEVYPDPPGIHDPPPFASSADSNLPFGPTKDEQLVNDALSLFLRAVTIFPSELRCEWYSARSPFDAASFDNNSMTARTDGYLEANGEVFSIVEVKPPPPQEAGPYCGLRHHYNYAQCQP